MYICIHQFPLLMCFGTNLQVVAPPTNDASHCFVWYTYHLAEDDRLVSYDLPYKHLRFLSILSGSSDHCSALSTLGLQITVLEIDSCSRDFLDLWTQTKILMQIH